MWETNPKLKMLSLVFIFVFLFSGIALVIFSVWSNQYRQKIYEETQNSLPKHGVNKSTNQQISDSEIKDWITYKNEQYGFEVRMPNNWQTSVEIKSYGAKAIENFGDAEVIKLENTIKTAQIVIIPTKPISNGVVQANTTLAGFAANKFSTGNNSFSVAFFDDNLKNTANNFWDKNSNEIQVSFSMESEKDEIQKILSTFKFTNFVDTSTWKTYKNDQYGVEFIYPKDLLIRDKIYEAECESQGKPDCKLDIVNYDLGVDYIKSNNYPKESYCDTLTGEKCEKMIIGGQDVIVNWQWGVYIPVKGVHNIFFEFKETEKVNKELLKQILSTFKFTK